MQRATSQFSWAKGAGSVPAFVSRRHRFGMAMAISLIGLCGAASVQAQGLTVKPGEVATSAVSLDLDCNDLVVNGILNAPGVVFTRVGNVIIGPQGQLNAANTTIEVTKSWQNAGAFNAAGSSVVASGVCSNTSTAFSGSTSFGNLAARSAGHSLTFAAGSEQTVNGALTLNSVTLTGQGGTAFLTLASGGSQSIANVGVSDVDASHGQRLAPSLSNAITGQANNWFDAKTPTTPTPTVTAPVPATGPVGLTLLAGLMLAAAHWTRRKSGKSRSRRDAVGE